MDCIIGPVNDLEIITNGPQLVVVVKLGHCAIGTTGIFWSLVPLQIELGLFSLNMIEEVKGQDSQSQNELGYFSILRSNEQKDARETVLISITQANLNNTANLCTWIKFQ